MWVVVCGCAYVCLCVKLRRLGVTNCILMSNSDLVFGFIVRLMANFDIAIDIAYVSSIKKKGRERKTERIQEIDHWDINVVGIVSFGESTLGKHGA